MPDSLFSFTSRTFDSAKLKSQLKMSMVRLDIDGNKKSALMKQTMNEIVKLLSEQPISKEEIARYRTESLIRDDNTLLAYELVKTQCHLLLERVTAISSCKQGQEPPPHLVSCISDIMYASKHIPIAELTQVRKQLKYKFGKSFQVKALSNSNNICNEKLVRYLSIEPLTNQTVNLYMQKICKQHGIDYNPIIELGFNDIMVLEPAVTGLDKYDSYPHAADASTVTTSDASSSGQNNNNNDDEDSSGDFDLPPCAPTAPRSSYDQSSAKSNTPF